MCEKGKKYKEYARVCLEYWAAGKGVVHLIKCSLEKVVKHHLTAAGWQPQSESAKYHYDFIMREVPKMTDAIAHDSHAAAQVNLQASVKRTTPVLPHKYFVVTSPQASGSGPTDDEHQAE